MNDFPGATQLTDAKAHATQQTYSCLKQHAVMSKKGWMREWVFIRYDGNQLLDFILLAPVILMLKFNRFLLMFLFSYHCVFHPIQFRFCTNMARGDILVLLCFHLCHEINLSRYMPCEWSFFFLLYHVHIAVKNDEVSATLKLP